MVYSSSQSTQVLRVFPEQDQTAAMILAEEVAIALSYGGTTHAVMMATPVDLEDFAIGFSLTEGLIASLDEVEEITILEVEEGIDVQIRLSEGQRSAFQERRRHMAGPVGCGLCGIESLEAATRHLPRIDGHFHVRASNIEEAFAALVPAQQLNKVTRCAHAAGFYVPERGLVMIREDVGRHNALDKLIGALLRQGEEVSQGIVLVTSRLSVEMVQKAAIAGAPILAAVSAATVAAVKKGLAANMTLLARVRGRQFEIYANPQRIDNKS